MLQRLGWQRQVCHGGQGHGAVKRRQEHDRYMIWTNKIFSASRPSSRDGHQLISDTRPSRASFHILFLSCLPSLPPSLSPNLLVPSTSQTRLLICPCLKNKFDTDILIPLIKDCRIHAYLFSFFVFFPHSSYLTPSILSSSSNIRLITRPRLMTLPQLYTNRALEPPPSPRRRSVSTEKLG